MAGYHIDPGGHFLAQNSDYPSCHMSSKSTTCRAGCSQAVNVFANGTKLKPLKGNNWRKQEKPFRSTAADHAYSHRKLLALSPLLLDAPHCNYDYHLYRWYCSFHCWFSCWLHIFSLSLAILFMIISAHDNWHVNLLGHFCQQRAESYRRHRHRHPPPPPPPPLPLPPPPLLPPLPPPPSPPPQMWPPRCRRRCHRHNDDIQLLLLLPIPFDPIAAAVTAQDGQMWQNYGKYGLVSKGAAMAVLYSKVAKTAGRWLCPSSIMCSSMHWRSADMASETASSVLSRSSLSRFAC